MAGTWTAEANGLSYYMTLNKDGAGEMDVGGVRFILNYERSENPDSITITIDTDVYTNLYSLSHNGRTLSIKNLFGAGTDVVFTKAKQ